MRLHVIESNILHYSRDIDSAAHVDTTKGGVVGMALLVHGLLRVRARVSHFDLLAARRKFAAAVRYSAAVQGSFSTTHQELIRGKNISFCKSSDGRRIIRAIVIARSVMAYGLRLAPARIIVESSPQSSTVYTSVNTNEREFGQHLPAV